MRAPLNLERDSRTRARARACAASTQQSEQLATYIAKGSSVRCSRVLGHFHETSDENSNRLLCPLERVRGRLRPLPHRTRPLLSPSRRSRPGDGWRSVGAAGFDRGPRRGGGKQLRRSIRGGKPRRMLRITRGNRKARWKAIAATEISQAVKVKGEEE